MDLPSGSELTVNAGEASAQLEPASQERPAPEPASRDRPAPEPASQEDSDDQDLSRKKRPRPRNVVFDPESSPEPSAVTHHADKTWHLQGLDTATLVPEDVWTKIRDGSFPANYVFPVKNIEGRSSILNSDIRAKVLRSNHSIALRLCYRLSNGVDESQVYEHGKRFIVEKMNEGCCGGTLAWVMYADNSHRLMWVESATVGSFVPDLVDHPGFYRQVRHVKKDGGSPSVFEFIPFWSLAGVLLPSHMAKYVRERAGHQICLPRATGVYLKPFNSACGEYLKHHHPDIWTSPVIHNPEAKFCGCAIDGIRFDQFVDASRQMETLNFTLEVEQRHNQALKERFDDLHYMLGQSTICAMLYAHGCQEAIFKFFTRCTKWEKYGEVKSIDRELPVRREDDKYFQDIDVKDLITTLLPYFLHAFQHVVQLEYFKTRLKPDFIEKVKTAHVDIRNVLVYVCSHAVLVPEQKTRREEIGWMVVEGGSVNCNFLFDMTSRGTPVSIEDRVNQLVRAPVLHSIGMFFTQYASVIHEELQERMEEPMSRDDWIKKTMTDIEQKPSYKSCVERLKDAPKFFENPDAYYLYYRWASYHALHNILVMDLIDDLFSEYVLTREERTDWRHRTVYFKNLLKALTISPKFFDDPDYIFKEDYLSAFKENRIKLILWNTFRRDEIQGGFDQFYSKHRAAATQRWDSLASLDLQTLVDVDGYIAASAGVSDNANPTRRQRQLLMRAWEDAVAVDVEVVQLDQSLDADGKPLPVWTPVLQAIVVHERVSLPEYVRDFRYDPAFEPAGTPLRRVDREFHNLLTVAEHLFLNKHVFANELEYKAMTSSQLWLNVRSHTFTLLAADMEKFWLSRKKHKGDAVAKQNLALQRAWEKFKEHKKGFPKGHFKAFYMAFGRQEVVDYIKQRLK